MSLVQVSEVALSLDERRERIYERLSAAAIDIGNELLQAKQDHRLSFAAWVEAEMPWSLDVAERMMRVARAFSTATPEEMAALPRPYSTLYELTKLDPDRLQRAIQAGEVTPATTHRQATAIVRQEREAAPDSARHPVTPPLGSDGVTEHRTPAPASDPARVTDADLHAIGLMRQNPQTLRPELADELRTWLP